MGTTSAILPFWLQEGLPEQDSSVTTMLEDRPKLEKMMPRPSTSKQAAQAVLYHVYTEGERE